MQPITNDTEQQLAGKLPGTASISLISQAEKAGFMDRQDALREIRANWEPLLQRITAPAKMKVNGRQSYICPFCGHGTNGDGMTYNPKGKTGNLKCFGGSCDFSGDIVDVYGKYYGQDFNGALNLCAAELNITIDAHNSTEQAQRDFSSAARALTGGSGKAPETGAEQPAAADYTAYYKECQGRINDPAAVSFLTARGISQETARAYNLGYDPTADPANAPGAIGNERRLYPRPRIIIPISKSFYIGRRSDGGESYKKSNPKGSSVEIFNLQSLYSDAEAIFVTEGIFDALAVCEAGAAAIALNSAANAKLLIDAIEQRRTEATLVLCLDSDKAGQEATEVLRTGLELLGIKYTTADICGQYKDPNEALVADRAAFIAMVDQAIKAATADYLQAFLDKIQTEAYKPYRTELTFFDNLLNGGVVRQSLLLLLAAPGTGKTSLAQQVLEAMALHKKQCVYLNLEMSREQMLAKAISSHVTRAGQSMTALDVLQGYRWTAEQRAAVIKTMAEYREKVFPYLEYNPAGVSGDLEAIKKYLWSIGDAAKAAGREAPAIVLDYLHLVSSSAGLDTQELIKQTVFTLKQYAIRYDTFVIGIVATNRLSNAAGRITMESGRDSSNLEYTADYQISLNYYAIDKGDIRPSDTEEMALLQQSKWRQMIIRVLKGRLCIPGKSARVYFNAANNLFYGENDFMPADVERVPFDDYNGSQRKAGNRR